jgi:N-terminal domain of anti-restriction factor ArdC
MLVKGKEKEQGKIRSVRQAVRAGVELVAHDIEAGHPEVLSECLKAMARFRTYSFGNVLLIATQRPTATQVAGWRGWNELGRRVKQGERGIMIFAPILSESKKAEQTDEEASGEASEPHQELLGFRPVRVFDVEQTEGEEQPEAGLFTNPDLAHTLSKLTEFASSQAIHIEYSDNIAPARGTSYRGVIRLLPDMEAGETVSVLVRELAVQMLYETQRRSFVTRDVLLREARAVAFVVCDALAFVQEPAENIQLYRGNLNLLAESLEVVQRTAAVILHSFGPEVAHDGKAVQQ